VLCVVDFFSFLDWLGSVSASGEFAVAFIFDWAAAPNPRLNNYNFDQCSVSRLDSI
jgi:hypothetical protein